MLGYSVELIQLKRLGIFVFYKSFLRIQYMYLVEVIVGMAK
jgi:hypothetical protein